MLDYARSFAEKCGFMKFRLLPECCKFFFGNYDNMWVKGTITAELQVI